MENFFYNDEFYADLGDYIDTYPYLEDIEDLDDNWKILVIGSNLEPIAKIDASWIMDRIDERRLNSEDDTSTEQTYRAIEKSLDAERLMALMPKLYYPDYKNKVVITKQDLIEYIK